MYFVFLLLWIILNGQVTAEIVVFGIVIAGILYGFCCKFLEYSMEKDLCLLRKLPYIILYILILMKEIVKANVETIRMVLTYREQIDPVIVSFKTELKSEASKVILANSITLTPGTITVSLTEDEFMVHALDAEFAKGLDKSLFIRMLLKMEAIDKKTDKKRGE